MLGRLAARFRDPVAVPGLYLWGSVGRGKTFLVDLLFEQTHGVPKRRWHFHRFMGEVHARLRALPDTADTLAVVARDLSADLRLLVLDEFFVGDIGDAMILGRLLDQLIARGVTLVTTSNIPPSELYRDGLQRASFLPCIALIERNCQRAPARQPAGLSPAPAHPRRDLPDAARDRQRAGAGRAFRTAGGHTRRARPRPCS